MFWRSVKLLTISSLFVTMLVFIQGATFAGSVITSNSTLYSAESSSVSSNRVDVVVMAICGLDINDNFASAGLANQDIVFPKTLTSIGNITDNVTINLTPVPVTLPTWQAVLLVDDNGDGLHQVGEVTPVPANLDLPPGSQYLFFVIMSSTASGVDDCSVTLNIDSTMFASGQQYLGNNSLTYGGPSAVSSVQTARIISDQGPVVTNVKFDGVPVIDGDFVGTTPLITLDIMDIDGINTSSVNILVDGANIIGVNVTGTSPNYSVSCQLNTPLAKGTHIIRVEANDIFGNTGTHEFRVVITHTTKIVGRVLPYPSPYNPNEGPAKITYQLTSDSSVRIYVYTITGERIWAETISKGDEGGHSGFNEVLWDGETGFHRQAPNGVYLIHIYNNRGKLLGKTKILVIR